MLAAATVARPVATEILPELKEAMSREQWAAMGDAMAQAKEAAGLPLPPPPRRKSSKRTSKSTAGANSLTG